MTETVVVYLWVPSTMNSQNAFYGNDWNGTLINLTWNETAHVGTIDLNTLNFVTGGGISTETTVNDFMLILRNPAGNRQSADLTASNYGYSLSVLPVEDFYNSKLNLYASENEIHISGLNTDGDYALSIYDSTGRQVKNMTSNSNQIDISEFKTGIYFVLFETSGGVFIRKKIIKQ